MPIIFNSDIHINDSAKSVAFILFLTFLFFQIPGYSQSFNAENYVVTNFGLEEGLPQSSVNDIIQSKDGYIWLATWLKKGF